jgi:hypothetical protein
MNAGKDGNTILSALSNITSSVSEIVFDALLESTQHEVNHHGTRKANA